MENRSIRPKIIIILLSLLFLTGAIAAAFSFGGGRLLAANPVFAQPAVEALEQNVAAPVTGSSSEVQTLDNQYAPSGYGCHHDSTMNPEDW